MSEPVRFCDSVTIRVQPEVTEQISRAARAKGTKPSEWARQALIETLRADGFDPTPQLDVA
jgi:predicted transcriptional regulator